MKCLECINSRFVQNEDGVVDFVCLRLNKTVFATTVCLDSKRFKEEDRARKIYIENFQRYPLSEIARMIGWSVNKLNWFVIINFLPHGRIRKRKELNDEKRKEISC